MKITLRDIQERWSWDEIPVPATAARIRLAIKQTRNSYGITAQCKPYIHPRKGMTVQLCCSRYREETGVIVDVMKPLYKGGDPEVCIKTDRGRIIYLFQTALHGYSVIALG